MLKYILHTGLAVPDLEQAIAMYQELGFKAAKRFHKPDLAADVAMMTKDDTTFELFEFHDPDHPQVKFIRNHIAIYSDALQEDIATLSQKGYKVTIPITEGIVFRFAYVQDAIGTNYEIATDKT